MTNRYADSLVALALTLSWCATQQTANAQGVPGTAPATTPSTTTAPVIPRVDPFSPTVLPTESLPTTVEPAQRSATEQFQIKVLQKLPARMFMTGSVETSLRYESNPFQFPTKRRLLSGFPQGKEFFALPKRTQQQFIDVLGLSGKKDGVFRVLANGTVGWAVNERTRVGGNYFVIRDSLFHDIKLNTTVQSMAGFVQRDIPIGSRANLMLDLQCRELFQTNQQPQFDFLPSLSLTYQMSPSWLVYANTILQMRGKKPFQSPTKEIDPFYTVGTLYQRNGWIFSSSGTLFQAFREPFGERAIIAQDSYTFILNFEVARRLFRQLPGLQAFCRAEPIYNFHSKYTPGLSGMDFRLFGGLRMSAAKRSLATVMDQLREDLNEELPNKPSTPSGPTTMVQPHEVIASSPQPIHGFISENDGSSGEMVPDRTAYHPRENNSRIQQ